MELLGMEGGEGGVGESGKGSVAHADTVGVDFCSLMSIKGIDAVGVKACSGCKRNCAVSVMAGIKYERQSCSESKGM